MLARLAALALSCALLLWPCAAKAQVLGSGTVSALSTNTDCRVAESCASFTMTGSAAMGVSIIGTFTATLTFEATVDGINWYTITVLNTAGNTTATTATAAGLFTIANAGYTGVRLRCTAYTSGSAVVTVARGYLAQF